MAEGEHGQPLGDGAASGVENLLMRVARARDEARRLNLPLSAHLLDVVCLDLSTATSEAERRRLS